MVFGAVQYFIAEDAFQVDSQIKSTNCLHNFKKKSD